MIIEQLLGNVAGSLFMEQHYLKLPFALAGGCAGMTELATWKTVESILPQEGADVVAGREGRHWEGPLPKSLAEAQALLAAGYMLGIRHAERHDAGLAKLAAGFQQDFLAPIDIHLFCTPAGNPGYGWHYDAEDVFVLQTQGSKEWWLRKNTVNPWPLVETLPADMRYEREIMPVMRCKLAAGDWLYVPAGYWHRTESSEESISLSIGVLSAAALDVFDHLRRQLLDSLQWRQRLPAMGAAAVLSEAELHAQLQNLFAELGSDLARQMSRPEFLHSFLAKKRG